MKQFSVVSALTFHGTSAGKSSQKINQADISVLRKADIRDQLARAQKAFSEEVKSREKVANKAVSVSLS